MSTTLAKEDKIIVASSYSVERVSDWHIVRVTVNSIKWDTTVLHTALEFEASVRLDSRNDEFTIGVLEVANNDVLSYDEDTDCYAYTYEGGARVALSQRFTTELLGLIENFVWHAQINARRAYNEALAEYGF